MSETSTHLFLGDRFRSGSRLVDSLDGEDCPTLPTSKGPLTHGSFGTDQDPDSTVSGGRE